MTLVAEEDGRWRLYDDMKPNVIEYVPITVDERHMIKTSNNPTLARLEPTLWFYAMREDLVF